MTDTTATVRNDRRRVRLEGAARVDRSRELKQRLLTAFGSDTGPAMETTAGQVTLEIDLSDVEEADLSLFQLLYSAGRMARGAGVDRVFLKATGSVLQSIDLFGMRAGLEEVGVVIVEVPPQGAEGLDANGT